MTQAKRRDEIDMIVDDILASPERVEEWKARLRDRLDSSSKPTRPATTLKIVHSAEDPESLWDNLPV
ncbi:MAG: hypothetical protein WBC68_16605 [Albidovulum sp.]